MGGVKVTAASFGSPPRVWGIRKNLMPRPLAVNGRKSREWNQDIAQYIEAALAALDETLGETDPVKIQRHHREVRKLLRMAQQAAAEIETIHAIAAMRDAE